MITLGQLLEDKPKLEVARPSEPLAAAMERMREHNYSQLPVVADPSAEAAGSGPSQGLRAIGLISTATIANASLHLGMPPSELRVRHAIDEHPLRKKVGDELWRTLDEVRDGEILLIEEAGELRGILTGHDFTTFLRRQSEDSMTVLDIEATVKQLILEHFRERDAELRELVERELGVQQRSLEKAARAIVSRCLASVSVKFDESIWREAVQKQLPDKASYEFDRLTFHQYQQILLGESCWAAYREEFDLPLEKVRALLDVARELRNQIMHNRGLPSSAERAKLIFCRTLVSRVADRRQVVGVVESGGEVVVEVLVPTQAVEPTEVMVEGFEGQSALTRWLECTRAAVTTANFDQLDQLIALPPVARVHRSWWSNDERRSQSAHWLDAGWQVDSVNMAAEAVIFVRVAGNGKFSHAFFTAIFDRLAAIDGWTLDLPVPGGQMSETLHDLAPHEASLSLGIAKSGCLQIALELHASEAADNKAIFDALVQQRDAIEREVGALLNWDKNPHRRASRISLEHPHAALVQGTEELAQWVAEYLPKFQAALVRYLPAPR